MLNYYHSSQALMIIRKKNPVKGAITEGDLINKMLLMLINNMKKEIIERMVETIKEISMKTLIKMMIGSLIKDIETMIIRIILKISKMAILDNISKERRLHIRKKEKRIKRIKRMNKETISPEIIKRTNRILTIRRIMIIIIK